MHIIVGSTGHIGSEVVRHLYGREDFLALTHSEENKQKLEHSGVKAIVVDVRDTDLLNQTFSEGTSAFILNPPGDITGDMVQDELRTADSMIEAITHSGLKKIVMESTQGAQLGEGIGDFGVLFHLEKGIQHSGIPTFITRAAYYMSNWDGQLENAKNGFIESVFPEDFKLPMVSPKDLGIFNAEKLMTEFTGFHIVDFSGPEEYSSYDVAQALSEELGYKVEVRVIPSEDWIDYFMRMGFSEIAAESFAKMTKITLNHEFVNSGEEKRGKTTLKEYIRELVQRDKIQ